jgi:hypothetical protein
MSKKSENEARVRTAIIQVWSETGECTQRSVALATGANREKPLTQPTIGNVWTRWEAAESVVTQSGSNGRPGAGYVFTWGAPLEATLQDVVAAGLQQGALPEDAQRSLRSAMRYLFGLKRQASDDLILGECATTPADQLYDVPGRVYEAILSSGASAATAGNLRSVVRRAMRLAAEQGLVPVIFPRIWEENPWEAGKWAYFPNDAPGLKVGTLRTYRANWSSYGREARELFSEELHPDDVSPEMVEQLRRHLITRKGNRYLARQFTTILSYIGKVYQVGPLAPKWHGSGAITRGYNGRVNAGYLVDAEGRGASNCDWDVFLGIFRDNGLPDDWQEFLIWYGDYCTLSEDEIERDPRFPIRPDKRELKQRTMVKRVVGIRAWAFQAIRVLEDLDGLGPQAVTLDHAFGTHGDLVARRLRSWWTDRAERGEVSDKTSAGLVDILKAGMMVARALYDRSRYERGISAVGDDGQARRAFDEEAMAKTPQEDAYWRTYTSCRAMIDSIEKRRRKSSNGHTATTAKDIRRIIQETPPAYWVAIQQELLRRVREAKDTGMGDEIRYHRWVMIAYLLGMMISCGFRIGEVTHIRIGQDGQGRDRQYGPKNRAARRIQLRACDRKNARRHAAFLRERYCPVWIEEEYLARSRPFFLARAGVEEHDWLFLDAQGRPYGCTEESDDGEGRDDIKHSERVADLRNFWCDQLMAVAASLGLEIPYEQGEFAPHVLRNVFGYLLYQTMSRKDAANYLGDQVASVEETYASCDGVHVDVSEAMVDGLSLIKSEVEDFARVAPAPAAVPGEMSAELALLMQAKNEGYMSDELFVAAMADLNRRYARAA